MHRKLGLATLLEQQGHPNYYKILRDASEAQPLKDINELKKATKNILNTVKDTEGILKAYQILIDKGGGHEFV